MFGFDPDMDQLTELADSLGVEEVDLLSNFTRRELQEMIDEMESNSSRSTTPTSSRDMGLFEKYANILPNIKESHLHERSLPPKRLPLTSRGTVLDNITQARTSLSVNSIARQTSIGTNPSFSNQPLEKLEKVALADLLVRKIHKGKYLLCRIISHAAHLVALNFVVEDQAGNATNLSMYNYPGTLDISLKEADSMFPIGTILAIREPFFKLGVQGGIQSLRVDSPSDLVFIHSDHQILKGVNWITGATLSNAPKYPTSADGWKELGASEFKSKRWLCAASYFSEVLRLDSTHILSRLNRAETYLRLEWFHSALNDCNELLKINLNDDSLLRKAVFRAAKASYFLGQYDRTMEVTETRRDDMECCAWREKAKDRIREKATGQYDWCSLFQQAQRNAARADAADYIGSVEVKESKRRGGGRGVFASRDVDVGELLIVSKPIACVYPEDNPNHGEKGLIFSVNFLTETVHRYTQAALIYKIVQNAWDSLELSHKLKSMYAGPLMSKPHQFPIGPTNARPLVHARRPVTDIDVARIEAIVSFNSFSPVPFKDPMMLFADWSPEVTSPEKGDVPSALYFLPSFINHSCIPSARYCFFGDVMVIRASKPIRKGEEVTIEYQSGTQSLSERSTLKHWGFDCECALCVADRVDGEDASDLRHKLVCEMVDTPHRPLTQMKALLRQVEASYEECQERKRCGTKPDLALAYGSLISAYGAAGMERPDLKVSYQKQIIEAAMDSLTAVGMIIKDRSISGAVQQRAADYLPVDNQRVPTHYRELCTLSALEIAVNLKKRNEKRRAQNWIKVALWLEDVTIGGGKELFMLRFGPHLSDWKMLEFVQAALNA